MCKIANVIVAIFLMIAAYSDWKTKRISVVLLSVATLIIVLFRLVFIRDTLWPTLGGIVVGLSFLLISRVTKEAIGYGDSWLILLLGIFMGGKSILEVIFRSGFAAGIFGLLRGTILGWNKRQTIPFVPFLFIAYLGVVFL